MLVGQKIGDSDARLTAPVHSSVSGAVSGIVNIELPGGKHAQAVSISNDGEYEVSPDVKAEGDPMRAGTVGDHRGSGTQGLWGWAGSLSHVFKLSIPPGKRADADRERCRV